MNMEPGKQNAQDQGSESTPRKPYRAPSLVTYGDFHQLTFGGSNRAIADGGTRTTKNDL